MTDVLPDIPPGPKISAQQPHKKLLNRMLRMGLYFFCAVGLCSLQVGDVLPTPLDFYFGLGGAAIGIVVAFSLLILAPAQGKPRVKNRLLNAGVLILFSGFMFFVAFGQGLASLYTSILGMPGEQTVEVDHWRNATHGACGGPDLVGEWLFSHAVCLDPSRKSWADSGMHLLLKGKASPLGLVVGNVQALDGDTKPTAPNNS